ncbi:hypothetical protein VNO80_11490 [Phaseolus coccineus]|uniref:Uncharacterized protein n=1 Tax=Phaseolus coccineus TaxID=3886 RepID=A0AAN9REZ4_PHACN
MGGVRGVCCAGVLSSTSAATVIGVYDVSKASYGSWNTRPNQGCYHSEPLHAAVGSGSGGGMKVLAGMGFSGGEGDTGVLPILNEMANIEGEKDNGFVWLSRFGRADRDVV